MQHVCISRVPCASATLSPAAYHGVSRAPSKRSRCRGRIYLNQRNARARRSSHSFVVFPVRSVDPDQQNELRRGEKPDSRLLITRTR